MSKYGAIACEAVDRCGRKNSASIAEAWEHACRKAFPHQLASQKKSCPRGAFIGLCAAGLINGIAGSPATKVGRNGGHAMEAVRLLAKNPSLSENRPADLWREVLGEKKKAHNAQMDVVLALWKRDLVNREVASRIRPHRV